MPGCVGQVDAVARGGLDGGLADLWVSVSDTSSSIASGGGREAGHRRGPLDGLRVDALAEQGGRLGEQRADRPARCRSPRLSLTTIGVFLICCTTSMARATVVVGGLLAADDLDERHLVDRREEVQPDEVLGPARRRRTSSVIGSVEVFEASSASGFTTSCTSPYTLALSAGSSKTASITESQPARSAGSAVGVIRARISAFFSSVIFPRLIALSRIVAE